MSRTTKQILRKGRTDGYQYAYATLLVLLILTLGASLVFYRSTKSRDAARFSNEVGRIQGAVTARVDVYAALLNGAKAYVESSPELDRKSFAAYVRSLEIGKNFAGIRRVGLIRSAKATDVDADRQTYTFAGETFRIVPFERKDSYCPLVFSEPEDGATANLAGVDLQTEPNRWAVMQEARDTGRPVATARVPPFRGSASDDVVVIFVPVYKRGASVETIEDRRANISAYLYASFHPEPFLSEIEKSFPEGDLSVSLFEGTPERTLQLASIGALPQSPPSEGYEAVAPIDVAGREWTLQYKTLPSFTERSSVHWTPVIFFSGIGISFLLFGLAYREAGARADLRKAALELIAAQNEVRRLFEEEKSSRLAAEQASRAKDEFLAVLSHELRTPLNAIAGWTRILRVGGLSEETRRTALEKIERNLRQQTSIVDELLTYSDAMSRGPGLKGHVSVSEAFERAIEWAYRDAAEKNIEIVRENLLQGETITGDVDLLATAIESVLSNAIKFSPPNSTVRASASAVGREIVIRVEDRGSGIGADFLPHVFEQYTQADHAYTRSHGGLGLGLPIAQQIVTLHGGSIAAESEGAGQGAVFTINLPLGVSQGEDAEAADSRPAADEPRKAQAAGK